MGRHLDMTAERPTFHHGDVPAAAVTAAELLVDRKGADAVTVRAVALEVGVSHTALYRHFDGRDGVLDLVAARFLDALVEAVPPGATLADLLTVYADHALARPNRYRLAFALAVDPLRAPATAAALGVLRDRAGAVTAGAGNKVDRGVVDAVLRAWATAHGMLDLYWRGLVRARSDAAAARYVVGAAVAAATATRS